ncbi:Auxin-induced protein 5NG4 [Hordeum vulgare]|nr:Auxin-induced protein 5NG4 [Hordeum vulgare]
MISTQLVVERTLRVWAFSCWRGARGFAEWFLRAGFAHLPTGSPVMFRLDEVGPNSRTPPIGLTVTFTNSFDTYYLLGKVFSCGCEFIAFTTHDIYTNFVCIFPPAMSGHRSKGSGSYWVHEGRVTEVELDISPKVAGEEEAEEWLLSSSEKKK